MIKENIFHVKNYMQSLYCSFPGLQNCFDIFNIFFLKRFFLVKEVTHEITNVYFFLNILILHNFNNKKVH